MNKLQSLKRLRHANSTCLNTVRANWRNLDRSFRKSGIMPILPNVMVVFNGIKAVNRLNLGRRERTKLGGGVFGGMLGRRCPPVQEGGWNAKLPRSVGSRASIVSTPMRCTSEGSIDVIMGPMFAGKTSALLERVSDSEASGHEVLLLKHSKDSRYSSGHVVTHNGVSRECCAVASLNQFKEDNPQEYDACDVIAIDEAQFFQDLVSFCRVAADEDGKHVIVAGLDGDFMRRKFGQVLDLLPLADSVEKLNASCFFCSQEDAGQVPAVFSLRIADTINQEHIGGAESYVAACRRHYMEYKPADATK